MTQVENVLHISNGRVSEFFELLSKIDYDYTLLI